ncbi:OpgC domain-containing protein [Rhodobacter sp. SGA-6-6]|uniref:OpgC family protein n=1 Tax=Rhodobacter sp. SGA-6-6 TaxID=2710882 RepID=UPI0013EC64F8|nr:OpgC domain-containing protein [Rhodobacter sp. SGA-6-6]NGM45562.1 OpgC domain-containing protein [Rhodobacter sp. SGA-6-6]
MPEPRKQRDHRIDFLRGLALVMIFVNHVPGTVWENFTSRNFGFSDAAEGFVLMSGIASGLAFGPAFLAAGPWAQRLRPWRRALVLWAVHVPVCLAVLALFALTLADPGVAKMATARNIAPVLAEPWPFLPALAALSHQFAYADILPLYIVLLLAAPGLLALAVRWPKALMAGSLALWFLAGLFRLKFPTWPQDHGWFFNPFSWQVLFVAGILTGLALRQGRRLLPVRRWALALAWGFVLLAAVWVQVPAVAAAGGHGLWLLGEYLGLPSIMISFDKSFLFLPRLLHILALAYVLSVLPGLKRLAAGPGGAGLAMLGRHSLPVFAAGTLMAYAAQVAKVLAGPSFLLDTAMIAAGIGVLFLVARLQEGRKVRVRAALAAA